MSSLGLPLGRETLDEREATILTTALLLGCELRTVHAGRVPFFYFEHNGEVSQEYRSKITCCDMYLSQIGVYVDPQGGVYLPPNFKG